MGFSLVPRNAAVGDLFVNFWNWRPTVSLIGSFDLIDNERLELLEHSFCGGEVSAEEAVQIADRIERDVLAKMPQDGRVLLDLSVTTEPDDGTLYKRRRVGQELQCHARMATAVHCILPFLGRLLCMNRQVAGFADIVGRLHSAEVGVPGRRACRASARRSELCRNPELADGPLERPSVRRLVAARSGK